MTERMNVIERSIDCAANRDCPRCHGIDSACIACQAWRIHARAALSSIRTEVAAQQAEIAKITEITNNFKDHSGNLRAGILPPSMFVEKLLEAAQKQQAEIAEFRADYASMETRIRNISAQMDREREASQAEIAALRGLLRCRKTGNLCGTDTRQIGNLCACECCQAYRRLAAVGNAGEQQGGCMADWAPGEEAAWNALTPEQQKVQGQENLRKLLAKQPCDNASGLVRDTSPEAQAIWHDVEKAASRAASQPDARDAWEEGVDG